MAQTFDVLSQLIATGQSTVLVRAGLISPVKMEYYQIVQTYEALRRKYPRKTVDYLVRLTADSHKCSLSKVYKARLEMK